MGHKQGGGSGRVLIGGELQQFARPGFWALFRRVARGALLAQASI